VRGIPRFRNRPRVAERRCDLGELEQLILEPFLRGTESGLDCRRNSPCACLSGIGGPDRLCR